jgi:Meckelin (Transmembrane protein 67)
MFFEMFIQDRNKNLIDVPVLLRNFRNRKGELVNTGTVFSDSWRLVRRFFVYDTVSGIDQPDGYIKGSLPQVVRWASQIKVKITLDPTKKESIYTPYIDIAYRESKQTAERVDSVSFIMDYYQEMDYFWKQILIAFLIFQVVIAVIVGSRLAVFLRQNPKELLKDKFCKVLTFKLIYLIMDVWAGIMFWIIFFTSAYWFVTYKLQGQAYLLLPSIDNWGTSYRVFDAIFGIVLAFRFLSIVFAIFEQASVDIFLIDWEAQPQMDQFKN